MGWRKEGPAEVGEWEKGGGKGRGEDLARMAVV